MALVDERELVLLHSRLSVVQVVELALARSPVLVAVDSPRARDGGPYYGWVRHGLALFHALAARDKGHIAAKM